MSSRQEIRKDGFTMKEALLIIDVQNDYFPGGKNELYHPEQALHNIQTLLTTFREKKNPIYYIQHISSNPNYFFAEGTTGANIHDGITPRLEEPIIIKHAPNSFFQTELQSELQKAQITNLVVCGMMTHMCVDTTVRAAKDLGYDIQLISDACTTMDLVWKGETIPAKVVNQVYLASLCGFGTVSTTNEYLHK